ncbi:MAG: hypothetical protein LC777_01555 [Actinobacteria bacterium]|nr:hypothetical protein [Actinomycetota bacterium]
MESASVGRSADIAWRLLDFSRSRLDNLEESASRIVAGQVAGLIALWSALWTFDDGVPRVLAWAAWAMLLVGITWLGRLITPRRLAAFWERLRIDDLLERTEPLDAMSEAQILRDLSDALSGQIERLRRGVHVSVIFGLSSLTIAALAYVIDQAS